MRGVTPGFEPTAHALCQSLAASGPVSVADFDDEWAPAGETYRDELVTGGLVEIDERDDDGEGSVELIVLTGAGVALAQAAGPPAPETTPQP